MKNLFLTFELALLIATIILVLLITSAHAGADFRGMRGSSPIDLSEVYEEVNKICCRKSADVLHQELDQETKDRLEELRIKGEKILEKREELKFGWNLVFRLIEDGDLVAAGKQLDMVYSIAGTEENMVAFHPAETVRQVREKFRRIINRTQVHIMVEPRDSPTLKIDKQKGEDILEDKPFLLNGWRLAFQLLREGADKQEVINQLDLVYDASIGSSPVGGVVFTSSIPITQ